MVLSPTTGYWLRDIDYCGCWGLEGMGLKRGGRLAVDCHPRRPLYLQGGDPAALRPRHAVGEAGSLTREQRDPSKQREVEMEKGVQGRVKSA